MNPEEIVAKFMLLHEKLNPSSDQILDYMQMLPSFLKKAEGMIEEDQNSQIEDASWAVCFPHYGLAYATLKKPISTKFIIEKSWDDDKLFVQFQDIRFMYHLHENIKCFYAIDGIQTTNGKLGFWHFPIDTPISIIQKIADFIVSEVEHDFYK